MAYLLERDELLACLSEVGVAAVVGMRKAALFPGDRKPRVTRGFEHLQARDLARKDESGKLSLHPELLAMADTVAHPGLAIALTRDTPALPTQIVVWHQKAARIVEHALLTATVHRWDAVDTLDTVLGRLLRSMDVREVTGVAPVSVAMGQGAFEAFGQLAQQGKAREAEARIEAAGLVGRPAQRIVQAWTKPLARCAVAIFKLAGTEITDARQLVVVQGLEGLWLVTQEPAGSGPLRVETASLALVDGAMRKALVELKALV